MVSFRRNDHRFARDDPIQYTHKQFGGGMDLFYTYVPGVTAQYSELNHLRGHPDGMVVDGAINIRGSTLEEAVLDDVTTRYDLHAPGVELSKLSGSRACIGRDLNIADGHLGRMDVSDTRIARYLNGRDACVQQDVVAAGAAVEQDADFRGAHIGDDLVLRGATVDHVLYLPDTVGGVVDLRGGSFGAIIGDLSGFEFRFDDETVIGDVRVGDRFSSLVD